MKIKSKKNPMLWSHHEQRCVLRNLHGKIRLLKKMTARTVDVHDIVEKYEWVGTEWSISFQIQRFFLTEKKKIKLQFDCKLAQQFEQLQFKQLQFVGLLIWSFPFKNKKMNICFKISPSYIILRNFYRQIFLVMCMDCKILKS